MTKSVRTFRVDADLYDRIRSIAARHGLTPSDVVRNALTALDEGNRKGIVAVLLKKGRDDDERG